MNDYLKLNSYKNHKNNGCDALLIYDISICYYLDLSCIH